MTNIAMLSDWNSSEARMPPHDGFWYLFVYGDLYHFAIYAWSEQDGEWIEPDERNTGYTDESLKRQHPLWMPAPSWMPLARVD